jgi:uncharacterized damage-inducible protein DinB
MDRIAPLRRLFRYDAWANGEALAALARAGEAAPPQAVRWLAHVAGAERLWLDRLRDGRSTVPVWPDLDLAGAAAMIDEAASLYRDYLDTLVPEGLDAQVNYVNSQGQPWTSRVEDILQHVVMHGTYHRGQIAAALRAAGATPAVTDFIHAVREGLIE